MVGTASTSPCVSERLEIGIQTGSADLNGYCGPELLGMQMCFSSHCADYREMTCVAESSLSGGPSLANWNRVLGECITVPIVKIDLSNR